MQGTWKTTGGGADFSGLFQLAVIVGLAAGIAIIIAEFAWLVITVGVVAVAVRLYLLYRRTVILAAIAAKGVAMRAEQQAQAAAALAGRRAHEIEVARAGATIIQNIIDPASITAAIAAAVAGAQQQPWAPQPVPLRMIPGTAEEVRRG